MMITQNNNRYIVRIWLLTISILFFLLALILTFLVPLDYSNGWILIGIGLALAILLVHFVGRYIAGDRDILSIDKLFLVSYAVFHLGYIVPYSTGAVAFDPAVLWRLYIVPKALLVVTLGLAAFVVGYNLHPVVTPLKQWKHSVTLSSDNKRIQIWFLIGKLSIWVGMAMILFFIYRMGFQTLLYRRYGFDLFFSGYYSIILFTGGKLLVRIGLPIFFLEILFRKRLSVSSILTGGFVLVYLAVIGLFGVRSWLIMDILIPLVLTFHYFVRRISFKLGVVLLVMVLFISVVVERGRAAPVRTLEGLLTTYSTSLHSEGFNSWELVAHLGTIFKNVVREMSLVPDIQDYQYGKGYVGEIVASVPLVGGAITPGWYEDPDRWLTRLTAPWQYRNFEGIGFSYLAEAHWNFGIAGVIIILFITGWGGGYLYRILLCRQCSIEYWLFYVVELSSMLFVVRQSSSGLFRPLWVLLALWVLVVVLDSEYFLKTSSVATPQTTISGMIQDREV